MTNISKGFSPLTKNETQAEKAVVSQLDKLDSTTKDNFGVQRSLAITLCDYAYFIGSKKNNLNTVPDAKVLKKSINSIIDGMYKDSDDVDIISRLKSSVADAVKLAQLAIGENTGFRIGYRLKGRTKDTFNEIPENQAFKDQKKGILKDNIIRDFFADISVTFPNMEYEEKVVARPSAFTLAKSAFVRDAHSIKFGDSRVSSCGTKVETKERVTEKERIYSFKTNDEVIRVTENFIKLLENEEGYLHLVASDKSRSKLSKLFTDLSDKLKDAVKSNAYEEKQELQADYSSDTVKKKVA